MASLHIRFLEAKCYEKKSLLGEAGELREKMVKMKRYLHEIRFILAVSIVMFLAIFILPFYSAEGYSILKHTTSHLGSQNSPNAWIMNTVFLLLGISCILESWFHLKGYWVHKTLLTIFGTGLILVALFQHAPIVESAPYNLLEDAIHSIFATIVGASFSLLAFSAAYIEKTNRRRVLALGVGLVAIVLSMLMFSVADLAGFWQRIMFIISFIWLIFFFEGMRDGGVYTN